jgi:hypothetical protein
LLRDLITAFVATALIVIVIGGVWLAATVVGNRSFIEEQCRKDQNQDEQLAELVEAAKKNPTLVPEQEVVYSAYLDGVKRNRREGCQV